MSRETFARLQCPDETADRAATKLLQRQVGSTMPGLLECSHDVPSLRAPEAVCGCADGRILACAFICSSHAGKFRAASPANIRTDPREISTRNFCERVRVSWTAFVHAADTHKRLSAMNDLGRLLRTAARVSRTRYPGFIFGLPLARGEIPVFTYHDVETQEFARDLEFLQATAIGRCPWRSISPRATGPPARPRRAAHIRRCAQELLDGGDAVAAHFRSARRAVRAVLLDDDSLAGR